MKDIGFYDMYAKKMLDDLGIDYSKNISYSKLKSTTKWGDCCKVGNNYKIRINEKLLEDSVEDDALMNTLIHEILHTVPGCMNHKYKWKYCAEKVNTKYHYNIKRVTNGEEKGVSIKKEVEAKYLVKCSCCGNVWHYHKKSKVIMNPENYHCQCGGKLSVEKC